MSEEINKIELMGKRVVVNREFWRSDYPDKVYHEQLADFRGWIVGFRTIQAHHCQPQGKLRMET